MQPLFHSDAIAFFGMEEMRDRACHEVHSSNLIQRAKCGDFDAAKSMHIGFWPFVHDFELAIDQKASSKGLHREPLVEKFGAKKVREVFHSAASAVREMKKEEGTHSHHWAKDAEHLGIVSLVAGQTKGVEELIRSAYSDDLVRFFSVLAGTEFIAEELSAELAHDPRYTSLFKRKRWVWGEVHLIPHDHGPSHLEIDLDLARAYSKIDGPAEIERMVNETIALFGKAAADVETRFCPVLETVQ